MSSKLLAWSAALTLVLAVGCGPSQAPETQEPQESQQVQESEQGDVESASVCPYGQKLCLDCKGGAVCLRACPICPPPMDPVADDTVEAAAACKAGEQVCPRCDGSGTYCATRCFLCAEP